MCLLLSFPACFALILASDEIINALFGYGSFSEENARLTSVALKYFGYGIPAFALIKVFQIFILQEIILKHLFTYQLLLLQQM